MKINPDIIYSLSLAIAFGFCLLSAIAFGISMWRRNSRAARICALASATAILFDLVSILVHFFFGHAPGSSEALSALDFLGIHPSFLIVGAVSIVLLWVSISRVQRSRH